MRKVLFLFACLFISLHGLAQISLRNETTHPLSVAIMYVHESSDFRGLVSKGWFNMIPGQTIQVLGFTPKDHHFYVYAKDQNSGQDVVSSLLNNDPHGIGAVVDPINGFLLQNPDMEYQLKNNKYGTAFFTYINNPNPGRKVLFSLR